MSFSLSSVSWGEGFGWWRWGPERDASHMASDWKKDRGWIRILRMLVYLTPDEGDYLREKDSLDCTFSYLKSISTVQLGIAKDDVMTRHPGQFDGLKPAGSFPCGSSIYISLTNSFDARFLAFFSFAIELMKGLFTYTKGYCDKIKGYPLPFSRYRKPVGKILCHMAPLRLINQGTDACLTFWCPDSVPYPSFSIKLLTKSYLRSLSDWGWMEFRSTVKERFWKTLDQRRSERRVWLLPWKKTSCSFFRTSLRSDSEAIPFRLIRSCCRQRNRKMQSTI